MRSTALSRRARAALTTVVIGFPTVHASDRYTRAVVRVPPIRMSERTRPSPAGACAECQTGLSANQPDYKPRISLTMCAVCYTASARGELPQQVRGASSHNQCPIQADPGLAAAARTTACVCTPRAETELSRSGLDLELMPKGIASSGAARLRSAPEIGAAVHIPPVLLADTSKNMSMNACDMQVHNAGPS